MLMLCFRLCLMDAAAPCLRGRLLEFDHLQIAQKVAVAVVRKRIDAAAAAGVGGGVVMIG